jgi:hypothetical protein
VQEPINAISYYSKLVGVTFEGRQDTIAKLKGDEPARFRREPENEYDSNAVAVDVLLDNKWQPVGYIARDKNAELAEVLSAGKRAGIQISELTGGDDKSHGINVYITYEKKPKLVRSATAYLEKDIFGNEIFYDDVRHQYTNSLGEVYLSGSAFAGKSEKPFDAEFISGLMANKAGDDIDAQDIRDMWRLKAEASASLGTAIHAALELYGKYRQLAEKLGKETHLHDNTILNKAVTQFYEMYPETDNVGYEVLVVDHKTKRAGRIDRLEYNEDGTVTITDFKTNFDVKKSLKKYWLQLSFYAAIIEANGLKVRDLKIYHYADDTWLTYESEVIDIDAKD